jgi:glutamate N-acetyltransferase/amino-acid N-acetyltransferase
MSAVSPLAPANFPQLPSVAGLQLATHEAGLRYTNRADLFLALLDPGSTVAGVFTKSLCPSAPVDWCRSILSSGRARAIVCNSGNANAFTGKAGETSAVLTAQTIADAFDIDAHEVHLASTGVIGESLPDDRLADGLLQLSGNLQSSGPTAWEAAANAIRTTDTFAKGASARATVGSESFTVVGIAKGSGMIAPDMATMLGFLFTDAAVAPDVLQSMLADSTVRSFNRITVDSDTSTSDTVLLFATGGAGNDPITSTQDPRHDALADAVRSVTLDLAHQIVRDGEGATKFVEVTVSGAASDEAASVIALSIANSPLVKTALAAEDANWGRIVMAVGKAGEQANRDALKIWFGDELVANEGVQADGYSEERATEHLRNDEVKIVVDVGVGAGEATVWTCDLTHGYIEINAGYRS